MRSLFLKALGGIALLSSVAYGQIVNATVTGQGNPFLAGMPSGTTCCTGDGVPGQSPAQVSLTLVPGAVITFSVSGSVNDGPGASGNSPDGSNLFLTGPGPLNGIGNFRAPANSLIGVFLGSAQPDGTAAPATLDFGTNGITFTTLSPLLKQVFFIGDGLTGTGTGAYQQFVVPTGATRLFIAASDTGPWIDNTGSFSVTVTQSSQGTISPSTLPNGNVNVAYSQTLTCVTGCSLAAPTWTVSSGSLPPGLNLISNVQTGTADITGTPTQTGTYNFIISANANTFQPYQLVIAGGPLAINTETLPDAHWGVAYSFTFEASGGTPPYHWQFGGEVTPPSWLTLDPNTGTLTGTPPVSEMNTTQLPLFVDVFVTDNGDHGVYASFDLNITTLPLTISTQTLPAAVAGQTYSKTIEVVGGTLPYSFSMPIGTSIGLNINGTTGAIGGRPLTGGVYPVQVNVLDSARGVVSRTYSLQVLDILTRTLPNGLVGTAYSTKFQALGTVTPAWGLGTGSVLPDGLTLGADGVLSGTPTKGGVFPFVVTLTDGGTTTSVNVSLTIATGITITTETLPVGIVGTAYSQTITRSGGTAPFSWLVAQGTLPAGLSLNASSGAVTGTPTTAGTSSFTVTVTDSLNVAAQKVLSIKIIDPPPAIVITTTSLPNGFVTVPYSATLASTGATSAVTWSITAGTLPGGLSLDGATGAITGTPTTAGTSNITVKASYDPGTGTPITASAALAITISAPPTVSLNGLPTSTGPGQQPPATVALSGNYPVNVTGTLTLTFQNTLGADNPEVRFANGTRTASFSIPAGTTAGTFGSSSAMAVLTGTVAGTITITQTATDTNGVTIQASAPVTITVTATVPVITSVKINQTSGGFNLVITGYSTPRNMVSGTFHFAATSGNVINPADITVPLGDVFGAWYNNPASLAVGSQFVLTVPFTTSGGSSFPISAITVTLTNSQGASNPATANP